MATFPISSSAKVSTSPVRNQRTSDADTSGVDIDSSACDETGSVNDNDGGCYEGVNLSGGK